MADDTHGGIARIHASLVLSAVLCASAFGFELWRALSGNQLSWVYVFEWPILLAVAVHLWRLMLDQARGRPRSRSRLTGLWARRERAEVSSADVEALAAWNRYVADLDGEVKG
ncbi:MAG: hypothetical protein ACLQNG_07065 [Acidimicrobiales bacterium]